MTNSPGAGKSLGLIIGMFICVAIGIAISELRGYNDTASGEFLLWSIIYSSAVGLILGKSIEKFHQRSNLKKAIYIGE